jgi:hypothetical protein
MRNEAEKELHSNLSQLHKLKRVLTDACILLKFRESLPGKAFCKLHKLGRLHPSSPSMNSPFP